MPGHASGDQRVHGIGLDAMASGHRMEHADPRRLRVREIVAATDRA